ncbi:MAG: hypothetical protein H3C57_09550 [Gammaproteobacteria bacterium]|nr:hypothetical protein [Gammaproteobacteria bacterium]
MQAFKVGLVMLLGLGSTWAARGLTDAWLGPPLPATQLLQSSRGDAAAGAAADADAPVQAQAPTDPVPQLSREELEEELRRARAELAGKPGAAELEEFRPSRPLAADVAIAMPSDI